MTTMRSTDFRAIVEPIMNKVFDGRYEMRKDEWKAVFEENQGMARAYDEEAELYAFGAAPEMPDGTAVTYQSGGVLFVKRYDYKVYGLAFALTKTLVEDGDHIRLGTVFSKHLANALIETKETKCANVLNRAFNGSYVGGDGVALCVNNHPIRGGTYSNLLQTPAALSQTSLEQALTQLRSSAVDNNGKPMRLEATRLIIPPQLEMTAEVLLNTALRTGTNNNDINPIKSLSKLPGGAAVMTRLTSATAWFIQSDADRGLQVKMRRKLEKSMEGDFETDSMRYKATERYTEGWTNPRAIGVGTPGA
jgi:hypothetical protein